MNFRRHSSCWHAHLRHRVPFPKCHCGVFKSLEIKGYCKGDAELIVPGITTANGRVAVVLRGGVAESTKFLLHILRQLHELRVAGDALVEWQDSQLVWCYTRRELEDASDGSLVIRLLRPDIVRVLQHAPENSVNAEGGFHHTWHPRNGRLFFGFGLRLYVLREKLTLNGPIWESRRSLRRTTAHVSNEALQFILWQFLQPLLHSLALLLEGLHNCNTRLLRDAQRCHLNGRLKRLSVGEVAVRCLCVCVEVKASSVRDAHALQPTRARLYLSVPTVACIVRHLRGQVLAETAMLGSDTNALQEEEGSRNEVSEGLIVDKSSLHSMPDGELRWRFPAELKFRGVELQLQVFDALELRMALVSGFHEPLDFGLTKFPQPGEAPRRNLVAEDLPDLYNTKRHLVGILFKAELVVQEYSLGCFRPQVSLFFA
mmetsp:Transcript_47853/g.126677  ORF Transcript_47853/g.126677 Transcript_47853/m.126677 type:complete len:429 (-) Transcript_47853:577-1863(-)